jgi:hypothetical protein
MSIMTVTDLADLLRASAPQDSVHVNFNARTPLWRGIYGPFVVITGSFQNGGDFEFAIRIDKDSIAIGMTDVRANLFLVD